MRSLAAPVAVALTLVAFSALPDDSTFLQQLAVGGRTEVEAGQLAANKAQSDDVRKFGMMMAKDHGNANKKIEALAREKGVTLPAAPPREKTEDLKSLQSKEGPRFDQEYMAQQVAAHEKTVQLLKTEISSGSPETKALAQELLPTVETHLREAYRLTGQKDKAATPPTGHP
jgi:putative membrane protein